ncbi:MAG: hypothetical protein AAGC46_15565 [Solirubrobacteraceae bacterium]|nr:hypothetical protein [Patulibacter sp.]
MKDRIPRLRALVATAVVVSGVAGFAPAARAGDYVAYVCKTPDGRPVKLDPYWKATVSQQPATATESCANGGPISQTMGGPGGVSDYTQGPVSSWVLTTPPHIALVVFTARRVVTTAYAGYAPGDSHNTADWRILMESGGVFTQQVAACQFSGCALGNAANPDDPANTVSFTPSPTTAMGIFLTCYDTPGGTCQNPGVPRLTSVISRMALQMRDDAPPTVDGIGGTALAAAPLSGTPTVDFVAQDQGAGVYQYVVALDGRETARGTPSNPNGTCADALAGDASDLEFTSLKPCPDRADVSAPVDTTRVADGVHQLTVSVRDASGNLTPVVDRAISVHNAAPLPAANGTGGDTSTGAIVADAKHRTVHVAYGKKTTVKRLLLDAAKRPIVGASVDVSERVDRAGATWTHVATVTTDGTGAFRYVPVSTASRTVRFSYARVSGGASASSIDVAVAVTAAMKIAAASHRVKPRGTIRLSGSVKVDGLPKRSRVEVQYRSRSGWRTISTERIDTKGRWSFDYRLTTARNTSIAFRSLLRPTADIAAAQSHSATTTVRVS